MGNKKRKKSDEMLTNAAKRIFKEKEDLDLKDNESLSKVNILKPINTKGNSNTSIDSKPLENLKPLPTDFVGANHEKPFSAAKVEKDDDQLALERILEGMENDVVTVPPP